MNWKKAAVLGVLLALVGGAGVASAAAWSDPAPAYGGCVSKSSGYVRILERGNLPKSVQGKCKTTETKISWFSRSGGKGPKGEAGEKGAAGPAGPAVTSWSWTADGKTYTCADPDKDLKYTCTGS
ncbi:hypothetical protein ABZ470_39580 [Streptosporangium sp. NPDC020072]|uniref:hypothetical protein n=1 Tax=Streptosporangium sp. NPDC020072 TaxID=3154788 RepID=UPI0034443B4C